MLRAALRIVRSTLGFDLQLADELRLERSDDRAVGPDDLAHDLRLVELAAVGQRRVGVDELDRRDDVVALPDAGLVRLAGEDLGAQRVLLPWFVGTMPDTSPGRSMPVGCPKPYCFAQ